MKRTSLCALVFLIFVPAAVHAQLIVIDPDGFSDGEDISAAFASYGVTLSSVGPYSGAGGSLDGLVYARDAGGAASTGANVFGNNLIGTVAGGISRNQVWYQSSDETNAYRLRADFGDLANYVALDFIAKDDSDWGTLEAYDSGDNLLAFVTNEFGSEPYTAEINRLSYDIAYIIASGKLSNTIYLDKLQVDQIPEPATLLLLGVGCVILLPKYRK